MTEHPEPAGTDEIRVNNPTSFTSPSHTCTLLAGYLEGLPLDLSSRSDGLGLDEESPRVDQLHTLQSLTRCCIQVLTLSHLGLAVPGQLQDRLRHSGGIRGGDLHRRETKW